jgi:lysophospholipase L1-like esterase
MRIVFIGDSLSLPRSNLNDEFTWLDQLIKNEIGRLSMYTFLKRGLSITSIDLSLITQLKPDIIITQFGIVDATRRAINPNFLNIVVKIPLINKMWKHFASKYHYNITRILNIHTANLSQFENCFKKLKVNNPKTKIFSIRIASPGIKMVEKVYRVNKDTFDYNQIIKKYSDVYVDPYTNFTPDIYLLEDGHHLNEFGHHLVYSEMIKVLHEKLYTLTKEE